MSDITDFTCYPGNLLSCCQEIKIMGYSNKVYFCTPTCFWFDQSSINDLKRLTNFTGNNLIDDEGSEILIDSPLFWPSLVSADEIIFILKILLYLSL